uniref:Uncharacterized protein n=1 Tax=Meloidogyne hapla TaxID=6305 RepID=A0A1I8BPA3_MELHA
MKDFQEAQFYCSTDQNLSDISATTMIPFMTGFEQPSLQLTNQDHQNSINSASLFTNYSDIYSLCTSTTINQEAKENENSSLKHREIKAEYNGIISNTTSLSDLMMKEVDQQKQQQLLQEQIEFNSIDGQSQVFNSYNNISSTQKEAKAGERTNGSSSSEQLSITAGQKRTEQQCDAERGKERSNERSSTATSNINNNSSTNKSFNQSLTENQNQQQFLPPPISVIVTHQQQRTNENKNNKQMDDDCWNIGGVNSEIGGNVSSMLIRDEFIFQPSHCSVSPPPPTTTIIGGRNDAGAADFLYDLSATTNPLLEGLKGE